MSDLRGRPESASNGPKNGPLPPKQEAAAIALASGRTIEQAAQASNSGVRTIKTWLHDHPAFTRRITDLRAEMTSRALGRLVDGMAGAAETLSFLSRRGKSEMVRLSAARAILELGPRLRETVELEERIAALEGRAEHRRAG